MMVPKVAGKGKSFKGAGLYYLHDKKASTAQRVAFTRTENLPTDDPELALRYMAYTALRQGELKAASGAARTGRKLAQSVYTYSLSWHPDEAPTQEHMIAAGHESLKILGLENHEIVMVSHNDEPHPHLHLIVNRVHPETGLAAKLSNDHLDLSRWAERYEREQGKIRCEQRVVNNAERRNGRFVKDTKSLGTAAFIRWRRDRLRAAFQAREAERKNLSAYHRGQREALFDAKEHRIQQRRLDIREQFRPKWAFLYRQQAQEKRELRQTQRRAFSRLLHWLQHRDEDPGRGFLAGALEAVLGRHDFATALQNRHEASRRELAARVNAQNRAAIREENEAHRAGLELLKDEQSRETRSLKEIHAKQSQNLAREIREGGGVEKFRKETAREDEPAPETTESVRDEFRKRVGKRIRKARKRDERGKGAGRERED